MKEHTDANLLSPPASGIASRLAGYVAKALRFWERRRIIYNATLALVVMGNFVFAWPSSKQALTVNLFLGLFVLAVLANVAYCAAYLPDIFVQFSGLEAALRWMRKTLFIIGTAFAAIVAHFLSHGMFEA